MIKQGSKKVQFSRGSVFLTAEEKSYIDKWLTDKGMSYKQVVPSEVNAQIAKMHSSGKDAQEVIDEVRESKKPITGNITRAIRETIMTNPSLSLKQIADSLHTSKNYVRNVRKSMVKNGLVKPTWRNKK